MIRHQTQGPCTVTVKESAMPVHVPGEWRIVPNPMRGDGVFIVRADATPHVVTTGFGHRYDSPAGRSIMPGQIDPVIAEAIVEAHNKVVRELAAREGGGA